MFVELGRSVSAFACGRNRLAARLVVRGVAHTGRELSRLLAPAQCPGCGARGLAEADPTRLCDPCAMRLRRMPRAGTCQRCGEPARSPDARTCGSRHAAWRGLEFAAAGLRYAGTGGALVRRLKLDRDLVAGGRLAEEMAAVLEVVRERRPSSWGRSSVLVPVPLHPRRRHARGFDQALWLADELGRRSGRRVFATALRRVVATRPQGDPVVLSRERNVARAFACGRRGRRSLVGRRVILIDDVATSGATARACARVLKDEVGVEAVGLVTAVRARAGEDDRVLSSDPL